MDLNLAVSLAGELVAEHRRRPRVQAALDDRPRGLQRGHDLRGTARRALVILPANTTQRIGERRVLRATLLEYTAEPVDARAGGVRGDRPDRPVRRRGSQLHLLVRKRSDRIDEAAVVLVPSPIERSEAITHSAIVRVRADKSDAPRN